MAEFFGTDGIRGVAGAYPLDAPTIEVIGYSLARHLKADSGRQPLILIGGDTRESRDWIEAAFVRGALTGSASLMAIGCITTPGIAYLTRALQADAGVVISASHNPYEDNGIKVFTPTGVKLGERMEQLIEKDLKQPPAFEPVKSVDGSTRDTSLKNRYLAFLRDEIGAGLKLSKLKLVIDCANGASHEIAPALFKSLGANVRAINVQPNGRNINLSCGSLHPDTLQKAVIEQQADLGLAFDGDADRLVATDHTGAIIDGDQILYALAKSLHHHGMLKGRRVVATVMSNLGLEVALAELNIALARTPVGDKYVLEELLNGGGSIGGEQSGHVIFPEISLAGDGMITALELLRVIVESGQSLAELTRDFKRYPQIMLNVQVSSKPPLEEISEIQQAITTFEDRVGTRGRLLIRYSGTENVVRVMVEGSDEDDIHTHANFFADLIRQHIG